MPTVQEKIAQAKAAGYSDDEIAGHLASTPEFADKIKTATAAGYKSSDIIGHLADAPKPTAEQPGMIATFGGALGKGVGNVALGAQKLVGKGLSAVGADSAGKWLQDDAAQGQAKLTAELAPYKAANPTAAAIGETGGEIIATLPVGGVLGRGVMAAAPTLVRAGASAPVVNALANSVSTGGFRAGLPGVASLGRTAADLGVRAVGGGITAGASGALIDPDHAATTALVGAALPGALKAAGAASGYIGRTASALVQPFTRAGQEGLAANIIRRFGDGGPMWVDPQQIVQGSTPTLAEATGNAGIAGLQRSVRDLRPNAFVEREAQNAGARNALFDSVAGDGPQLDFYKAARSQAAGELYDNALTRTPEATTPYMKGQITQLLKRPSIDEASRVAQRWAIERGEKPSFDGSLRALHDVKTAIDDKIAASVQAGQGGEVKALQATQAKLLDVMQKMSPEYGEARATYAAMSQPVNAMEALQGLKLTDARGNMTLAKVQNAISGLEKLRDAPGVNAAKSITEDQLKALSSIRDDLLRQDKLGLGRSAGSNTFQNIATDNLLGTMLPGSLGGMVNGKIGTAVGQLGKLAYSGANEKIRNNLVDMMLDPSLAQNALSRGPTKINAQRLNALADALQPGVYRAAPALSTSR